MATTDFVTGDRFKTALTGFKQYCESTYVKPTVATTLTGSLTVTGTASLSPNGKYIFMGGNNASWDQKRIYFNNKSDATNKHNIYLYGGDGGSNVGFGIYNAATSKAVWRYYDQSGYKHIQCTKPFCEHITCIYNTKVSTDDTGTTSWSSQTEKKAPFNTTLTKARPTEGTSSLYRTSNGVRINENTVNYVEVSGQVYIEGTCSGTVFVYIYRSRTTDGTTTDTLMAECAHAYLQSDSNYTYNIPPMIISVKNQDMIYLKVKARDGNSISVYDQPKSYLTVSAIG